MPTLWHGKNHASRVGYEFFRFAVEDAACLKSIVYRVMLDFEEWRSSPRVDEEYVDNPFRVGGQVASLKSTRADAALILSQSLGGHGGMITASMLFTVGLLLTGEASTPHHGCFS